jgi:hypothetical protein
VEDREDGWPELLYDEDWSVLFSALPSSLVSLELIDPFEVSPGFGSSLELLPKTSLTMFEVDGRSFFPDQFSDVVKVFPDKEEEEEEEEPEQPREGVDGHEEAAGEQGERGE